MPVFRRRASFEMLKNIKAFLNFKTGLTRDDAPGKSQGSSKIAQLRRRLAKAERENARLRARLDATGVGKAVVEPGNIVWIFGSGRSGSTWLMRMMGSLDGCSTWNEPMVGNLFGAFYNNARSNQRPTENFILGEPLKDAWLGSIRSFILDSVRVRYPRLTPQDYLIVKETTSPQGMDLLVEALPESRVILLIRDPRDVVSSHLDAARGGGWMHRRIGERHVEVADTIDRQPDSFVNASAERFMKSVTEARRAYDMHRGPKARVRYEDLRSDALATMKRLYSTLEIPVDEEQLAGMVEKHSWENIPEEKKGEGKFHRKGTPGGWREDLTPKQVEIVEEVTAPILEEFYRT